MFHYMCTGDESERIASFKLSLQECYRDLYSLAGRKQL